MFTTRELRLAAGLIVGVFATMHLANHALGLISVAAMEAARPYVLWAWQTIPGQIALYGALGVHMALGLYSLGRRRTLRMPLWEAAQLALGLAIPYLLLVHIVNTMGTRLTAGIDVDYPYELAALWVSGEEARIKQSILVLLVWGHFALGLHFWLRLRAWYRRLLPLMLALYVLVPAAALGGFAVAGMQLSAEHAGDPGWVQRTLSEGIPADPLLAQIREYLRIWIDEAWLAAIGVTLVFVLIRWARERGDRFAVTYPGRRRLRAPVGMSVLEVSRANGVPHMSVCGGRARCTTCRIRVIETADALPEPNAREAAALARIEAPEGVRLACQLRPAHDLAIRPILNPTIARRARRGREPEFGEERIVTVLFVDMRGSSRLAEGRLPFDVVFLVNQYIERMAEAVEAEGGRYSNFTGDGLMALYGLGESEARGARAALRTAVRMLDGLGEINTRLADELRTPLAVGIGIHTGPAIVGRMGPREASLVSALGDTVNAAARLENATKELGAPVAVSATALFAGGIGIDDAALSAITLRGREEPLKVWAGGRDDLAGLLAASSPPPSR